MTTLLGVIALILLLSPLWGPRSLFLAVPQTSLTSALGWGLFAQGAWILSIAGMLLPMVDGPLRDQFWYWTAILSVCPFISVLGARRPTNRVWNLFIVVPLIAVLGWPALTELWGTGPLAPLRIQTPMLLGFALILVMGTGNYLGTRLTLTALLAMASVLLALMPLAAGLTISPEGTHWCRGLAGLCWGLGAVLARRQVRHPHQEVSRWDRLWFDFRDAFGIVWSIRIQERLNAVAVNEKWACRLGPLGFEWKPEAAAAAREWTEGRLDHALRWHLRRFVDPVWIDQRLLLRDGSEDAET